MNVRDLGAARQQFESCFGLLKRSTLVAQIRGWSATFWMGLSALAYLEGDYQKAIADGKRAIEVRQVHLHWLDVYQQWIREYKDLRERNLRDHAYAHVIVGRAEWELKRLDDAEASLRRAVQIAREVGAQGIEITARAALAEVVYSRGDIARAEREGKEALAQSVRLGLPSLTTVILPRLGTRAAEQGRHEEALQAYREAMKLVEELRSGLQEAGLRGFFLEDKQEIYHGAVRSALALGKPEEAFSFAERGRARARQQVEAAERAYRAFLDRVRKENLEQASLMTVEPVTLPEVQALLPERTTLLEYLVTGAGPATGAATLRAPSRRRPASPPGRAAPHRAP